MSRGKIGKMHRTSNKKIVIDEIDRLSQMATYYEGLGCVKVARSLRQLVTTKEATDEKTRIEA